MEFTQSLFKPQDLNAENVDAVMRLCAIGFYIWFRVAVENPTDLDIMMFFQAKDEDVHTNMTYSLDANTDWGKKQGYSYMDIETYFALYNTDIPKKQSFEYLRSVCIGFSEVCNFNEEMLKFPEAAQACLLIALPVIVTGGIHLDGLIDTADARSSYSDRGKKLEILKDPHDGAFGIIRLALYLLLAFAALEILLCGNMTRRVLITALLIPVLSRICSGLTAELLPKARHSGMLSEMVGRKTERGKVIILSVQFIVCASVLLAADLISGGILLAAEGILILYYRHMALTEFGGVTGDLAGWYLCMAELAGVWALAAAGWIR